MKTAKAVQAALSNTGLSKYALAKALGMASSVSVNQWLRGTRMSVDTATKFEHLYGIVIDDSFSPPEPISTDSSSSD